MNYIFLDLETSGASTAFDSILECAAILTNDKLETLSTFHRKARLKEGIIPNLGALNVTGFDVNWLKQNPSPYSLITDICFFFKNDDFQLKAKTHHTLKTCLAVVVWP